MFNFREFEGRISDSDLSPKDKAVCLLAVSTAWNGILVIAAASNEERTTARNGQKKSADALAKMLIVEDRPQ